jgi:peptide/nickel transport system permease protein
MIKYISKRFLAMFITVLLISFFVYFIIQLPPGDYVSSYISRMQLEGEVVDHMVIEQLRADFGLDKPFMAQYISWIKNIIFHFDFGFSFAYQRPVVDIIGQRLGMTLLVSSLTMLFTYLVSIPIGIYSAVKQYSIGDYVFTTLGFIGMATPNFLFAIILMYLSFVWTGDPMLGLVSTEMMDNLMSFGAFLEFSKRMIIPVIVIGTANTCALIRTMRSQMLDEISKQYTLTARAKGLPEGKIYLKYCARAAINPIAASLGWSLAAIFTGSTISAIVMNLPTQGPVMLQALKTQDMYLAGSILLIMSVLTVTGTLVSDLLLAWLDPMLRKEGWR